jgi:PAS domain S-box-containing protein
MADASRLGPEYDLGEERFMNETSGQGWLYQRIVEDSPIATLYADRDGKIRLWNAGAEAMFGYSAEEALGQSLDLIVPERQRTRHWEGWARVMESGITKYGRNVLAVPAMRKDGSRISIEFNIVLLHAPSGALLGAAAMIQDVTLRWQQQKEMKARLAALEAGRVAEGGKTG